MVRGRARGRYTLGLREIAVVAVAALGIMALGVATALVLLTTRLNSASVILRDSVQSIRLAERAEIDLFVYERARDAFTRMDVENDLRRDLLGARQYVTSSAERAALDDAALHIERYLAANRDPVEEPDRVLHFEAAYRALEDLVNINIAQADRAQEAVARWDRLGTLIGISSGVLMLTVLGALLWWLRRRVVRPIYELSATLERFGGGDRDARAVVDGAAELRLMGACFNAMAISLARQHQARLRHLAGIAHDLRNPLSALQMSVALVDPARPLPPEDRVRHMFSVVKRQIARLNRMVGDLLDATRIEAGHLALRMEEQDIRAIVSDVAELFEDTSPAHSIRVALPDEALVVLCDPLRIEQTMSNLVSNAIKYSPRGGEVRIAAARVHEHVIVSVSDEGIGIACEDIDHMWEPFRRTGASAEAFPGVGLGLSIAKKIVAAHGGELTVESAPGKGSTFSVRLRLASAGVADVKREPAKR